MFGIPNLLKGAPKAIVTGLLGKTFGQAFERLFPGQPWGVTTPDYYRDAVKVDSVVGVDIQRASNISDYKIETGSFVSYNKVATPTIIRVRLTKGGSVDDRKVLLRWLRDNINAPTQFGILTPEGGYPNMTLAAYTIERQATSGVSLIIADCVFRQVRELPAAYSGGNVAGAENAPTVPARRVQASPSSYGGGFTQ